MTLVLKFPTLFFDTITRNSKENGDFKVFNLLQYTPVFQIGGTYAHPVIFPPQVAIGALGKIQVMFNANLLN